MSEPCAREKRVERTVKRTQRGAAAAKAGQTRKTSGARTVTAKAVRATKPVVKAAVKVARPKAKPAMPKWTKPPDALVSLFAKATEKLPGVQSRRMFGYPAAFVNGHMFAGVFQASVILRLSEGDLAAARVAINAELFEPTPGRVMREYVVVPNAVVQSSKLLGDWLKRGHAFASTMPAKPSKKA